MGNSTGERPRLSRRARRRQEILAATARVFAAKGYHSATTREIASAADVAEGTIFNYFPTKRDLLLTLFEQGAEGMLDAVLQPDLGLPVRQALAGRLEAALSFYTENRLVIQAIVAEAWTDPELLRAHTIPRLGRVAAGLERFLRDQIAAGHLRPFDAELGARLLLGMVAALVLPIVRGVQPPPGPEERHRLAEEIVTFLLDGVAARAEG
jgi:AcrR family transcriptional regulator